MIPHLFTKSHEPIYILLKNKQLGLEFFGTFNLKFESPNSLTAIPKEF